MKTFSQSKCTPVLLVFLLTTVFLQNASGQGNTPPAPVSDFEDRLVAGSGSPSFNDAVVVGGRGVFVGYRQESALGSWGNLPVVVRTDDGVDVKRLDLQPTVDGATLNNSGEYELRAVAYGNGQWMALGRDGNWNNGSRVWRSKDNAVTWSDSSQQGGMPMVEKVSGMGQYWGLAYGNGTWVAVGYEDSASARGIISYLKEPAQDPAMSMWQSAMLPMGAGAQQAAALRKVCFGNGTFVAIGDKGAIYTSVEGQNWVERSAGVTENLHGVAYGNGVFVVIGQAGSALVSKNSGQSWTRYELPVGGGEGIAFDGTLFGVEGSAGFAVSRDGEVWVAGSTSSGGSASPRPLAASANLGWLKNLGGTWFSQSVKGSTPDIDEPDSSLLGETGKAFVSYQIKTWSDSSALKASAYRAFGLPPGLTLNATTGVISGTPTASGNYRAVVYAGNANGFGDYAFIPFAIGKVGSTPPAPVSDFEDRLVAGSGSPSFNDAVVVGGRGVFVGYRQESALGSWGNLPVVVRTDDGVDVKRLDLQPTLDGATLNNSGEYELRAVAYGNGQWMALGRDGNWNNGSRVWRSKDNAVTWSDSSQQGGMPMVEKVSGMGQYWGLAYGNGTWVAVGYEDSASARGIISYLKEPAQDPAMSMWQSAMLPMGEGAQRAALRKVCFGNGTFVAIGDNGAIYTSVDGQNWMERSSGVAENLYGVAYGNGAFVVVGQGGSALVSKNGGQSWTRYELPVGGGQGIAFDGTVFGVEGSGGFAVSRDGEIWVAGGELSNGGSALPRPLAGSANLGWLRNWGGTSFSQSVKGDVSQIDEPDSSLLGEVGKAFVSYQIKTWSDSSTSKASLYRAFGLPPGLICNAATGVISGTPMASGNYRAVVYAGNVNGFGSYGMASFAISPAIPVATWTWSPANTSTPIQIGGSAFFGVENVTGSGAISYQWLKNGKPLSGKTSSMLTLNSVSLADSGNYALVITTGAGKVTTEAQKLIVENSGLAIYKLTGRGNWIEVSGRKPISFGGYILVDLTTMEGRGIFTIDHKTYGKYQTELSSSAFVMTSSGPWQGSTSLLSSVSDTEEAPAHEVMSFSGMDALIALDKTTTVLAPSTMAGFIHGYLDIAGTANKSLEVLTASLTLDKPQTLNAYKVSETLQAAYDRLTLELAIKGFEPGAQSAGGGSGAPPRPAGNQ